MTNVYRISVLGGNQFKTSNPETVARYKERAERALHTPIRVTKLSKVVQ